MIEIVFKRNYASVVGKRLLILKFYWHARDARNAINKHFTGNKFVCDVLSNKFLSVKTLFNR